MSKYKGQHGGKTGSTNSGRGLPPPLFGQCPEENIFFLREGFPKHYLFVSSVRSSSGYHGLLRTYILDNDYAILRLSQPVSFTDKVSPACLPDNWEKTYSGVSATATGWGTTDKDDEANTLQEADVTVISNAVCDNYYRKPITKNMICTLGTGEGACKGDSGGPLTVRENGRHAVVCIKNCTVISIIEMLEKIGELSKVRN